MTLFHVTLVGNTETDTTQAGNLAARNIEESIAAAIEAAVADANKGGPVVVVATFEGGYVSRSLLSVDVSAAITQAETAVQALADTTPDAPAEEPAPVEAAAPDAPPAGSDAPAPDQGDAVAAPDPAVVPDPADPDPADPPAAADPAPAPAAG